MSVSTSGCTSVARPMSDPTAQWRATSRLCLSSSTIAVVSAVSTAASEAPVTVRVMGVPRPPPDHATATTTRVAAAAPISAASTIGTGPEMPSV